MNEVFLVKWRDSSSQSGWRSIEDVSDEPLICESVGFVVKESNSSLVLALSLMDQEQASKPVGDTIIIPTESIISKQKLAGNATAEARASELWDLLHELAPFVPADFQSKVQSLLDAGV